MSSEPSRLHKEDVQNWPSGLVMTTLEELTSNLDDFLDRMEDFLEDRAAGAKVSKAPSSGSVS